MTRIYSLDVSLDDGVVVDHAENLLAVRAEHGQRDVLVAALARTMYPVVELMRQLRVHREKVFLQFYKTPALQE